MLFFEEGVMNFQRKKKIFVIVLLILFMLGMSVIQVFAATKSELEQQKKANEKQYIKSISCKGI